MDVTLTVSVTHKGLNYIFCSCVTAAGFTRFTTKKHVSRLPDFTFKWTYLSVGFTPSFICLAEVEQQLVSTFLTQLLHDVERAFAERLTHRVEKHKHQVGLFSCKKNGNETFVQRSRQPRSRWLDSELQRRTQPGDGAVHVKGVDHVSVHQTGRVHKCHQAELLLLGGGDLSGQIVGNTWKTQTTCVCRCFLQGSYRCDE